MSIRRRTLPLALLVLGLLLPASAGAAFLPDDPGRSGAPGGWLDLQWNLAAATGVDVQPAWEHLIAAGRPGGRGVVVAVLDTGVAYRDQGRFRRTPDISPTRFVRGYDFVDDDPYPSDVNGHGTHVASTIAETTDNGLGVTGIAYGARIMPVRVLNRKGEGRVSRVVEGIDWAVEHGAQIINLSVEFDPATRLSDIPDVVAAVRRARASGVLVVAASGNSRRRAVAYPARVPGVLAVGATTEHGCQAEYANTGTGLDLVAPGGGADAVRPGDDACRPTLPRGRNIVQMTYTGSVRRFGLPGDYEGTSMAASHVSAVAALVIASGVLGPQPAPADVERRLRATARDLGPAGYDRAYGFGLVDAGRATDPTVR